MGGSGPFCCTKSTGQTRINLSNFVQLRDQISWRPVRTILMPWHKFDLSIIRLSELAVRPTDPIVVYWSASFNSGGGGRSVMRHINLNKLNYIPFAGVELNIHYFAAAHIPVNKSICTRQPIFAITSPDTRVKYGPGRQVQCVRQEPLHHKLIKLRQGTLVARPPAYRSVAQY